MNLLHTSRPPEPATEVERWVLDSYTELRSLRASLHKAITGELLPEGTPLDEIPEKVAVVATELATNALTHAHPPTVVQLLRTDTSFVLVVADEEPGIVPELDEDRPPGAGGLGMQLARKLALDVGWYTDGDVKHVWAEFVVPPA
ncbi:ATP-binding protein [Actinoplanes sp. NPDC051633]|uniref:ATP-binding protein n=1 Tax=Actinoplanes sp. NPDC051633 TaxID=3155670 RepID=UPI00343B66FD